MRYGEFSDDTLRSYLRDKDLAWQRGEPPFCGWLTSPAFEVLDVTLTMISSRTRDECAKCIFYKPAEVPHHESPTYHPILVGEDFLFQTGVTFDPEAD